jgi:calcineurin-like phosphoesterase
MCGESEGVLGMKPELVVKQLRSRMPVRFEPSLGEPKATGVIFDVDTSNGKVKSVERIKF